MVTHTKTEKNKLEMFDFLSCASCSFLLVVLLIHIFSSLSLILLLPSLTRNSITILTVPLSRKLRNKWEPFTSTRKSLACVLCLTHESIRC